jgi:TonB dependent receptor/Carboxypeptidase regulatory-like domain
VNLVYKWRGAWAAPLAASATLLISAAAVAQGTSVLTGTVRDAATKKPVVDAVVTVTSPALQGEQTVVTDAAGQYRVPNLPPGTYTVRLEGDTYRPFSRGDIELRINSTIRLNSELLPEGLKAEEIVVIASAPTVDVGSTTTGVTVNADYVNRIPLNAPSSKGAATRSFESLAQVAPGAVADTYGVSIGGTTSPENRYVVDGVPVNNAAFGIIGTPLSVEFVKEANIVTGGYMPEYGRATGGQLDVLTKTGSNEFHGSVFSSITPGIFEGPRPTNYRAFSVISTHPSLSSIQDFGFDLGGPILKDKLWFYIGASPSAASYKLVRGLNIVGNDGALEAVPGTEQTFYATQRSVTFIGKLTYLINQNNTLTLTVSGAPTISGGNGTFGVNPRNGLVEIDNANSGGIINGAYSALAHTYISNSVDSSIKWSSAFNNKHLLVDANVGWHHEESAVRAADGTALASGKGQSTISQVFWQRTDPGPHTINDFEPGATPAACDPMRGGNPARCPVSTYYSGGPGALNEATLETIVGGAKVTSLVSALGHHVIKGGVDFEFASYQSARGHSGFDVYQETTDGKSFTDYRKFAFLVGPDKVVELQKYAALSTSNTFGGYIQDSWSILDKVTLNAGLRYDAQLLYGYDGKLAITLPNQLSPRVGVIYDFTQAGRSKLFANYARYYQSLPLDAIDRSIPGERQLSSTHDASRCDPRSVSQQQGICGDDRSRTPVGAPYSPNQLWNIIGSDKAPVDPKLEAESSEELSLGGEYEILRNGRVGLQYTKRWQRQVIEDMSRDEAQTYFIGNPGYGIASDFPRAARDYDAVTLYFSKSFSDGWLAQVSYTVSSLRGNWSGLFRPENGQLDPGINSDFDLRSLLANRTGPLPGDHTHQFKLSGAKDFLFDNGLLINVGANYQGISGGPTSYFGSHPIYGPDQAYILPRGAGERLPWVHDVDGRIAAGYRLSKASTVQATLDVFNLFNFQAAVAVDQRYTQDSVLPILNGTTADLPTASSPGKLKNVDGSAFDPMHRNTNFGNPIAYQAPRSFRIGVKVTF